MKADSVGATISLFLDSNLPVKLTVPKSDVIVNDLRTKIRQLEAGQGNSVYMDKGLEFNPDDLTIRDPCQLEVNLDPWLTWFEKDFILKHIKPTTIWQAV